MNTTFHLLAFVGFSLMCGALSAEEVPLNGTAEFALSTGGLLRDTQTLHNELDMVSCLYGNKVLCDKLDKKKEKNGYDSSVIHNPDLVHQESLEAMNRIDENATILNREALGVVGNMVKRDLKNKAKKIGKAFSDFMNEQP